jgi:chromosome segregation protein
MTEVEITKVKPRSIEAQKLKAIEIAVKEAEEKKDSMLERAKIVSDDVKTLEVELVALNNKKTILEQSIDEYNARRFDIEGSLDDTFEDLKRYTKEVNRKEKRVKELNIELDELDIDKIVKRTEDKTRDRVLKELADVLETISIKQKAVEALRVETGDLKVQKENLQKAVKDLLEDLENAKLHLTAKELRVINKDLQALAKNTKDEFELYEAKLGIISDYLEQTKKDTLLAEERCESAQKTYKTKQDELLNLQKEVEDATEVTANAILEKKEAEEALELKKKELASMQDQIDAVHKRSLALDQREKIIRAHYQALGVEYVEYKIN